MIRGMLCISTALCGCWAIAAQAQEQEQPPRQPAQESVCNDIPSHAIDIVLGRPTPTQMTVSVLCEKDTTGQVVYGTQSGRYSGSTPMRPFKAGEPGEVMLSGLQPDTRYFYRFRGGQADSPEHEFHTARPPGARRREIEKAASVATNSVSAPVATATNAELPT